MSNEKENKVVGIGHNIGNTVTKEQYAKVVNSLYRLYIFSRQEVRRVEKYLDEAFTKYPNSDHSCRRLKDFQIHESRLRGKEIASNFSEHAETNISNIESKANMEDVKLDIDSCGHPIDKRDSKDNS